MRHYEIAFLVHPVWLVAYSHRCSTAELQVLAMIERYRPSSRSPTRVHRLEDRGRRQLAYPVEQDPQGANHVLMNVECALGDGGEFILVRSATPCCVLAGDQPQDRGYRRALADAERKQQEEQPGGTKAATVDDAPVADATA